MMCATLSMHYTQIDPVSLKYTLEDVDISFTHDGTMDCDALFDYFIRAALAFGFQLDSVKDTVLGLAYGYEPSYRDDNDEE